MSQPRTSQVVGLKLLDANRNVKISAGERLPGYSSYFIGNDPARWRTRIPHYARVRYHQVYPGVDLVYYGRGGQLENDFVVAAGADAQRIRLGLEGVEGVRVDGAGDLRLKVEGGEVWLRRPRAYQGEGQGRREVEARYVLGAGDEVGFALGRYDRRRALVIDPVLAYATYLGGNGGDIGYAIAVDSSGDAYVAGTTASLNFPTTSVGQTTIAGGADAFVTKFNPSGSALIYSVYLGGGDSDTATGIKLDSSGNAYVVGYTYSTDFPTTSGAFQTANAGGSDAFITKLNPTGSSLVYSTYLGGTGTDFGRAIAIDASGDAFVTGSTQSKDFPTVSPLQIGNDGFSNAFVAELNPSGASLLYSTYFGGSDTDEGLAIALDAADNVYIAGYTFSTNFPTQAPFQASLAGGSDAFIAEINPKSSTLLFSTYLGGRGLDSAQSLAIDSMGSIYLAGNSSSDDFPTTAGAFQTANHGLGDAFVVKLAPGATQLVYSTLLGGSGTDQANGIALDSSGDAFVTGFTESSDFPLADAFQRILGISGASSCGSTLCADVFVSQFGPSGALVYSSFLGGSGADMGEAIVVDAAGDAYVTGSTASQNFSVIAGAAESSFAGSSSSPNAFVAKVSPQDAPAVSLSPQEISFGNQTLFNSSSARAVALVNAGSAPLNITSITSSGPFSQTNNCGTVVSAGGGTCAIQVTFTPTQEVPVTDQITIADDAHGSPQAITVTGTGVPQSAGTLTISPGALAFPAQTVGSGSPSQSVQLVNTGTSAVTVTDISVTGDYAETNTCGTLPSVLNVGAACTITISFTPTASGTLSGTLTVSDNAANGPQSASLTGTGNPVFSLAANMRSTVVLIGTKTATFSITASAPSSFVNEIKLSCSGSMCSFDPVSITGGQTSALTVSGLSAASPSPTNITVTGTSGNQSSTVALSVFLADFTLSQTPPSPPVASIRAGQSATYTITATPLNGFNQVVLLGCRNLPQKATCTFSPPGLVLNGATSSTFKLSISTTAASSEQGPGLRPAPPPRGHSGFNGWIWLAWLGTIFLAAALVGGRGHGPQPFRLRASLAVLVFVVVSAALIAACGSNPNSVTPGTPPNTYTITIVGTLGSDDTIQRITTVNLAVGP